jgi:SAM-dependent methyltransferase
MIDMLKAARKRALDRHNSVADPMSYFYSGTAYALWRTAGPITRELSTGLVLDAGSGRGGWREVIESAGARREALDIKPQTREKLDWIADLTCMPQVPSERFDAAVCHQVLEHIPHPVLALSELYRVLKPDGKLILSVPHLSRLHDLPHDYFRYTPAGIRVLLEDASFDVIELTTYGGLLTFVHHQFSTMLLGLTALLGPLYYLAFGLNASCSVLSYLLDRCLDQVKLMPNGVVVVAKKKTRA